MGDFFSVNRLWWVWLVSYLDLVASVIVFCKKIVLHHRYTLFCQINAHAWINMPPALSDGILTSKLAKICQKWAKIAEKPLEYASGLTEFIRVSCQRAGNIYLAKYGMPSIAVLGSACKLPQSNKPSHCVQFSFLEFFMYPSSGHEMCGTTQRMNNNEVSNFLCWFYTIFYQI